MCMEIIRVEETSGVSKNCIECPIVSESLLQVNDFFKMKFEIFHDESQLIRNTHKMQSRILTVQIWEKISENVIKKVQI